MKLFALVVIMSCFFAGVQSQNDAGPVNTVDYVNPLMGTDSKPALSNGNTYPAICLPWGMNMWTPQTGQNGNGWQYTYAADKIIGFKQTHQPSPWMNDYGMFSIMPVTGKLRWEEKDRASWFSHKAETARPYYYSVYLADADVTTEITPTERAAQFRFTFPQTDNAYLVIDAFDRGSSIKIDAAAKKITGYSSRYARGKLTRFKNYFVIYFDKTPTSIKTPGSDGSMTDATEVTADHAVAVVGFATRKGEQVHCRVASSYISPAQAELNLQRELAGDDFEATEAKAKTAWNNVLGRVGIEGGTVDQLRTFYSCLYRAVMFPNKLYELDADDKPVHYSPYNGQVLPGRMFAGTGFWDTFRALYPLLNLLYPSVNKEMQEGLVNDYKEGGWLPEWSSPGYADIMVGNNSASVVAEAYLKGLRGYDIQTLYEALVHGANNEGPLSAVGRKGVAYYNELGYVPYDVKINENAARTLEYAYDDFAICQLAKALHRPKEEIDLYAKRCQNYRNLFDKTHNLMRGKNKDGSFQSPFNPVKWGDAFTEGNSWHYSWSVFHDVQGLINLMGGRRVFSAMLDSVFALPPVFDDSYYGGTIHEIREMQIAGMGQYAHGNQPIQHMIYLYNYAGQPWKTQYWAREAMNRLYRATPDGYCGDEDNGQTSAWYVFSALGFYPVCPASDQYILGAPLFKKITLHLDNGNSFVIDAPANDNKNRYVNSISYNGEAYTKTWLSHARLQQGGTMHIDMTATPATGRRVSKEDLPYSFSSAATGNNTVYRADSTTRKGYTLAFLVQDASFSTVTQQRLTDVFFATYPLEAARFNPSAMRKVVFIIDPSYKGVAATSNGVVRCSPDWLKAHPEDIDVMTHEVMHIVQSYHKGNTPGWLTEGIADYARYKYGVNNEKGGWSLPPYRPSQSYTNAYRVTARFLVWLEENVDKQIVDKLNKAAFDGVYENGLWVKYTGKTVDELWKMYGEGQNLARYVNPMIGTQRMGHTFPGATVPFGMVQLSPDTDTIPYEMNGRYNPDVYKYCAGYQYDDKTIVGFSHTHFSGTGHSDLGDFLVMPTAGALQLNPGIASDPKTGFRSAFSHANEKAEAGYYRVKLDDDNIIAELTATTRVGFHQYTFPQSDKAHIILDLMHGIYNYDDKNVWTFVRVENDTLVTGYRQTSGWARTRTVYFAMVFSKPFTQYGCKDYSRKQVYRGFWRKFDQSNNFPDLAGRQLRMHFDFATTEGEKIKIKFALSPVSTEGALLNLRTELPHWDFDRAKADAQAAWNKELNKLTVEASEAEKQNFYTAVYHAFQAPTTYMDVDRRYKGLDQNIHTATGFTNYTTFSLWDTYRALHPLFNIVQPTRNGDMVSSMLAHYDQSVLKLLPIWSHYANDNWCMSGYHSASVIADAIVKGNTPFDANKALDACIATASHRNYEGIGSYIDKGYIPDEALGTSASTTLEYAYDDWSIAQAALKLGRKEVYDAFMKRSENYHNVFDPSVGFMRARKNDGSFKTPFDPLSTNGQGFIEGNTWNYSFFVPQNPAELIRLMGGKKRFTGKLDSLFTMYLPDKYFAETEDITRDGIIGCYVHGNEPAHHVAYLYNWTDQPWKTQYWVRTIVSNQYKPTPDGLGGNDDCGQMSAWYIFSALGFYPVAPGSNDYQLGSPAIDKAVIQLENGKTFSISTHNQSTKNVYVQKVTLNGKTLDTPVLHYSDITNGGSLVFYMSDKPKK